MNNTQTAPGACPQANQPPAAAAAGAGVYTLPADPARVLDALLNDRDEIRDGWERMHVRLVHELRRQPGAAVALDLAGRARAFAEANDLAADEALRLVQAWVQSLGGVVDVPAIDECQAEPAESEGDE